MNNVSDISNAASYISNLKLTKTKEEVEISILKKSMEMQKEQAQQIVELLKEAAPHLGQNINIKA